MLTTSFSLQDIAFVRAGGMGNGHHDQIIQSPIHLSELFDSFSYLFGQVSPTLGHHEHLAEEHVTLFTHTHRYILDPWTLQHLGFDTRWEGLAGRTIHAHGGRIHEIRGCGPQVRDSVMQDVH